MTRWSMKQQSCWMRSLILGLVVVIALLANSSIFVAAASSGHDRRQLQPEPSINSPFTHQSFSKLDHAPCVSLFTRNGRVGCGTADRSVEVGKLVYFNDNNNAVVDDSSSSNHDGSSIVIVVEDYAWTAQTIAAIQKMTNVVGILVLNATSTVDNNDTAGRSGNNDAADAKRPSPDARMPQGYGTASVNLNYGNTQYVWNVYGENVLEINLHGLPVAYVSQTYVADSIRDESKKSPASNLDDNNVVVAEFNYYMGPAEMNSLECLAWKDTVGGAWVPKCLPLAGTSVWASLVDLPNINDDNSNSPLPVLLIAAGMDATSFFHDISPGANAAASNILTILLAARLVGRYCNNDCLAKVQTNIVFALFQAEAYGFVGSRTFLRDLAYPGFTCQDSGTTPVATNPTAAAQADDKDNGSASSSLSEDGCLNPVRQSLRFANLGQITGMLAVDQVGHPVSNDMLYVHTDGNDNNNNNNNNNNKNYGSTLSTMLKAAGTDQVSVSPSSTVDNGSGFPYPPSPLTSLLNLSGGAVGGAVLTGFDYVYTSTIPYHSHWDVAAHINLDTVAAAATIVARTAVAAAVGGDTDYAVALIPAALTDDDDAHFRDLAHCFLYVGACKLLRQYSTVELANARARSGMTGLVPGPGMASPPNYYVGVYSDIAGQPFVQVGEKQYGAYDGADYGKSKTDAIALRPRQMEAAIRGLLNEYLGQHDDNDDRANSSGNNKDTSTTNNNNKKSCTSAVQCVGWRPNNTDQACRSSAATCTGAGWCVCERAHYHVALDEALRPAVNQPPGYFSPNDDETAVTPVFTEPFWSSKVGVRVYRPSGPWPGIITLIIGGALASASYFFAVVLKMGLKKEKLF